MYKIPPQLNRYGTCSLYRGIKISFPNENIPLWKKIPPPKKNQNTMLTNDNIIYFLNIKCSKERVYTNWLFFVPLKLILNFFAG